MPAPFVHWLEYSAIVALVAAVLVLVIGWFIGTVLARRDPAHPHRSRWIAPFLVGFAAFVLGLLLVLVSRDAINLAVALGAAFAGTALPFCTWQSARSNSAIPRELIDAARLDGCSGGQLRRVVKFPLTGAAFAVASLFSLMAAWILFAIVPVATESPWILGFRGDPLAFGPKETLLVSIPLLILFLLFTFFSRRSAQVT